MVIGRQSRAAVIRNGSKVLVICAVLFAFSAAASANTLVYGGQGTQNKRIFVSFDLRGKNCLNGPRCWSTARVVDFGGSSYFFPNCPDLLDSAFTYRRAIPVRDDKSFRGAGLSDSGDRVKIRGRFYRGGRRARGFFRVLIHPFSYGCTSGWIPWAAKLGG